MTCNDIVNVGDACGGCMVANCCSAVETCYDDAEAGGCRDALYCMYSCDGSFQSCAVFCDAGNFNVEFNELYQCVMGSCEAECI
jgi:hypothetical protein